MADIQIAVIDEKDTQIALAVPGIQGPAGAISSGGSANQVFYKVSDTNYDAGWTFIGNANVDAAAEIAVSKLADGSARQLLQTDAAGTGVEWASNIDIPGTLDVTSAATFDSTVAVTGALTKSGSNVVTVGDTGTVTSTMILDGTILNADINASAAIVDTKLATIATAGKVSNSATTAASANTASAIVARDASGNFTAGTITAALTGAASSNVLKAGDTMTGALVVPLASASTPSLTFTADTNTGIYSPGADQLAVATNGVERVEFGTAEVIFNDGGENYDFRVEGDTNANLLFVDASTDRVGIATSSPGKELTVNGDAWLGGGAGFASSGIDRNLSITANRTAGADVFPSIDLYKAYTANSATVGAIRMQNVGGHTTPALGFFYGKSVGNTSGTFVEPTFTEAMRIDSAGLVGIGTSSPSGLLHVQSNLAGNNQIILTNIASSNSGAGSEIVFTQGASGHAAGKIQCDREGAYSATVSTHDSALAFFTAADGVDTERLRITSAGLVGIGTTTPDALLTVNGIGAFGAGAVGTPSISATGDLNTGFWFPAADTIAASTTGSERLRIDSSGRLLVGASTTDALFTSTLQITGAGAAGTQLIKQTQTSTVGAIIYLAKSRGTLAAPLVVAEGDTLGTIDFRGYSGAGSTYVQGALISAVVDGEPDTSGDTTDMPGRLIFSTTADGGSSPNERMRITSDAYVRLASGSGGIQFNGDTAAANALDDYEEGTFTPTIVGTTTAGTGTYSIQVGVYTKIGNVVHYAITILWTAHTGTGNMRIDGLPFTARNLANYNPPVALDVNNLTSPADTIVTGTFLSNTTLIGFNSVPVAGGARAALAIDTAATIWLSGSCAI